MLIVTVKNLPETSNFVHYHKNGKKSFPFNQELLTLKLDFFRKKVQRVYL